MARPRLDQKPRTEHQKLGSVEAVTYSVRLPLPLVLRMEEYLHSQMVVSLKESGTKANTSPSSLIRDALTDHLDRLAKARKR